MAVRACCMSSATSDSAFDSATSRAILSSMGTQCGWDLRDGTSQLPCSILLDRQPASE
jgi:hypothetical protein